LAPQAPAAETARRDGKRMKIVVVKSPRMFRKILRAIFGIN
jgi:hypothetical protein